MAGKGDRPRPVNVKKYWENYEEIFRKKPAEKPQDQKEVSDTPETDALEHKQLNEGCPQWNDMMRWVRENAALAHKIERERDGAREALSEETKFHHRTHSELVQTQCKLMDAMQAIIATLEDNRHLADGDDCTLAKLKSVVPDWK